MKSDYSGCVSNCSSEFGLFLNIYNKKKTYYDNLFLTNKIYLILIYI